MNRLYAIESTPTTTGMKAEHRLGLRASEIPAFAAELAKAVGVAGVNAPAYAWTDEQQKFLAALAKDLKANAGKSAVIPGLYQDASVAALALAINNALGNVGKTVFVSPEPVNPLPSDQIARFQGAGCRSECGQGGLAGDSECQSDLHRARRSEFADAFNKAKIVAHLGSHLDETGQIAHWHIPAAHYLESWSDARAYDGTVSIVQPMIDPLYGGKTAHDVFQTLLDEPMLSAYEAVRETWKPVIKGDFETGWRKALHDGWIDGHGLRQDRRSGVEAGVRRQRSRADAEGFDRNHLPARSECLRRALVERGLAAGAAQAGHQSELGQCGHRFRRDADQAGPRRRRHRRAERGQRQGEGAGDCCAGPSRQFGHGVPGLRARVCRPRGFGRGLQCLPDPQHLGAVLRDRLASRRSTASGALRSPRATTRIIAERASASQGNGNNSLEADEALGTARHYPLRHAGGVQGQSRISRTRAKAATRPTWTLRSSPTGPYNGTMPGACRST